MSFHSRVSATPAARPGPTRRGQQVTFAVVIPTFNRSALVRGAIESALDQVRPADEVLVVDDGSTDDTRRVLDAYGDAIRALHVDRGGLGAARNAALVHATADYLVFLDDDDRLMPWALGTYEAAIAEHDLPTIVMSSPYRFTDEDELRAVTPEPTSFARWPDFLSSASARRPVTIFTAIRRHALEGIGGFVEHWVGSEDIDLILRLGAAPGYVFIDAPYVYAYRQAESSMSRVPKKLHGGVRYLLAADRRGAYGRGRRVERSIVLARNVRYGASRLLQANAHGLAADLLGRGGTHLLRAGQLSEAGLLLRRAARRRLQGAHAGRTTAGSKH